MPNWCEITVDISGEHEDMSRLITAIGENFHFDRIIPTPEELRSTRADGHNEYQVYYGKGADHADRDRCREELDEDPKNRAQADRDKAFLEEYGAYDWCDWRLVNWGTYWPPYDAQIDTRGSKVNIDFYTAWSFPGPIFQRLSEMFPFLHFRGRAVEPGMAWALDFEAQNGQLSIDDLDYDQAYPSLDEEDDKVVVS